MGGKGKKDTRTNKNKDKRGITFLAKDSGGEETTVRRRTWC